MQFVCRIGTPEGRVLEQVHRAEDEVALRVQLEGKGLHVFEIRRRGVPLKLRLPNLGLGRRRISMDRFLVFNQELAALLRAGLPLLQALELMLERIKDPEFRLVLAEVRDRVKSGEELSEAFGRFGDMFPPLYASSLRAGEKSGELERVLRRFIRYQQLVREARKRAVSALVYPTVLIGLSAILIAVMTVFVIPRFEDFYEGMDVELPAMTRVILSGSVFLRSNLGWLVAGLVVAIVVFRRWSRSEWGRGWIDRWKVSVPLFGEIMQRFATSEFCRSLSTLLAGGIPLVPALDVAVEAVGNLFVRHRLRPVVQEVREGKPLYSSLEETEVFADLAIDMVKVGETTGSLDEMLANVSDFFDEEVETKTQRLLTLVEPIMLVFMGIGLSLLLGAMYMPLVSIIGQLN